ncbi:uncharacterized protein PG998_006402 [Apiospora kogelbergensis]|uniref:uncharacterized protein n=1 Tax=Apiospora kogelbergensis TaxID=1337665 RepID=UPI003130B2ED
MDTVLTALALADEVAEPAATAASVARPPQRHGNRSVALVTLALLMTAAVVAIISSKTPLAIPDGSRPRRRNVSSGAHARSVLDLDPVAVAPPPDQLELLLHRADVVQVVKIGREAEAPGRAVLAPVDWEMAAYAGPAYAGALDEGLRDVRERGSAVVRLARPHEAASRVVHQAQRQVGAGPERAVQHFLELAPAPRLRRGRLGVGVGQGAAEVPQDVPEVDGVPGVAGLVSGTLEVAKPDEEDVVAFRTRVVEAGVG